MKKIDQVWIYSILIIVVGLSSCSDDETIPAPEAPTNLVATVASENQIDLSWTDNSGNETGFKVERKTGTDSYIVISTTGENVTTYSDNNLEQGKTYSYRIYAFNSNDAPSPNSNEVIATTNDIPVLSTTVVSSISAFSAVSGGNISNGGGSSIIAKGIVWSSEPNPTIDLTTRTEDGTGTDGYTSDITDLLWTTDYYVRSYATNATGTGYGDEITFTTGQATIETVMPNDIAFFSALSGGNIGDNGGYPITSRGIVWDVEPGPTIDLITKTEDGAGTGDFMSSLTDLASNVTYYVKSYAISDGGIAYGQELEFTTSGLEDIDGNIYPVVNIGTQLWMAENLKTTKYNNGTDIPLETDNAGWVGLTTGAYCWYDNDETANKDIFGALYNWYAIETNNLCPTGWHVPTDAEWTTLTDFLGGQSVAGGKMKATGTEYWSDPNTEATNESGFTGLPGGNREGSQDGQGIFNFMNNNGDWWSSTEKDVSTAFPRNLAWDTGAVNVEPNGTLKVVGLSCRCIKD